MPVAALTATLIAAASAAAAVGTLLVHVHFSRRAEVHAAREEALALAETRREIVIELEAQLRRAHQRYSGVTRGTSGGSRSSRRRSSSSWTTCGETSSRFRPM